MALGVAFLGDKNLIRLVTLVVSTQQLDAVGMRTPWQLRLLVLNIMYTHTYNAAKFAAPQINNNAFSSVVNAAAVVVLDVQFFKPGLLRVIS